MSDVDYKSVPCPACGAKAGRWCKRPSGHSGPMVDFHAARRRIAKAQAGEAAEAAAAEGVPSVEEAAEDQAEVAGQGESVALVARPAPGTPAWALEAHTRVKAEQGGDVLTFVRLGDFYESFGADAVTAAGMLDIVLTSVPGSSGCVAMTGVPWHVAENYFARLIARGHRVVVVEPDGAARRLTAAVAEERPRPAAPAALPAVVIPAAVFGVPVQLALF